MPDIHSASSDPTFGGIPSGTYVVDTERSTVTFRAKRSLMWVRGRLPLLEGSITIGDGRIAGAGLLAADRIETALAPRDWHLRPRTTCTRTSTPRSRWRSTVLTCRVSPFRVR